MGEGIAPLALPSVTYNVLTRGMIMLTTERIIETLAWLENCEREYTSRIDWQDDSRSLDSLDWRHLHAIRSHKTKILALLTK